MNVDVASLPENTADLKAIIISLAASRANLQGKEAAERFPMICRALKSSMIWQKMKKYVPAAAP
jgi:hypothetical protein